MSHYLRLKRLLRQLLGHSDLHPRQLAVPLLHVRLHTLSQHIPTLLPIHLHPFTHTTSHRLVIGLFSLIGLLGVSLTPLIGHFIDRLHAWHAVLLSTLGLTVFWAIETGAAGLNVAAVVITCLGLDIFDLMQQTSLAATALRCVLACCYQTLWVMIGLG